VIQPLAQVAPAYDGLMQLGTLRRAARPASAPQQLLPGRLHRPAALLLAACVAVTAALGVAFAGHRGPDGLDSAVDRRIMNLLHYAPALVNRVAEIGDKGPATVLTVILVLACLAARRWSGAVLAAVAEPAASALTEYVLKPLVGRIDQGALSFPSGHATGMFALAGVCVVLLADPPRRRLPAAARASLAVLVLLLASAVAIAMVALGWHYLTDAVAGAAVGIGVVLACTLTLDLMASRARRAPAEQPDPAG